MISDRIFREYDIRGKVPEELNRETAFALGVAFSMFLKKRNPGAKKVSVGRDVRLSSEDLAAALITGIRRKGLDVMDLGVCPTPLQYFSIFQFGLDGGIMVTGSHNPPEYNGFKVSVGKETIHGADIQALRRIIRDEIPADCSPDTSSFPEGRLESFDIIAEYTKYMLNEFSHLGGTEFRRIKIVIDAGNGTAGPVAPAILAAMGCDVTGLYCEPDGNFPNHHPDPTVVENIQCLISETKRSCADIGVGYDGDSDRIGVVNRDGDIIWGDQLMIALSREILKEHPGSSVIADVKCSQLLFEDVKKHGGAPVMWKTGHSLIKQKMRDDKAPLAGEFSGHIFIADRYFGFDDALYTTFRLVEIMKKTGKDIGELLSDIPKLFYTPEIRLDCPDDKKVGVVNRVVNRFIEYKENGNAPHRVVGVNTTDGARILFENGWGLIRTSNTQPIVVMRVEARSAVSLNEYRAFLETEFEAANADQ
jgi:phosphomannomutase / phosphoglucomutase